jgi:hypothetical protein
MGNVTTIGLDLAKSVFQVHGVDADGAAVLRQRLTRGRMLKFFAKLPPCLIGIEACASSHYWARELIALGRDVKLMPAQYVKPYVKRGKNDAADAEAICEAVTRPTMRFVGIKSPEQQSAMMLHRVRLILSRQRTQLSNALRAHLAEFGVVAPIGRNGIEQLLGVIADTADARVPADARMCLEMADVPGDAGRPAHDREGSDPGQRPSDHGARPGDRAWSTTDGDTGRRPVAGQRDRRDGARSRDLPFGPQPCCLDRAGAATKL